MFRSSPSSRLAARDKTQRKRCLQRLRIDTHPCSMKKDYGIGFRLPYEQIARSQLSHAAYPSPCDRAYLSLPQVKPMAHSSLRASNLSIRFAHSSAAAHGIFFDMRRVLRSASPTVACSTCRRHASNLTARFACSLLQHMSGFTACVESQDSLCLQLPVADTIDMRRTFWSALPAFACGTCLVQSCVRRTSQFVLPASRSTHSSVERASTSPSLCPQSFVAHVLVLTRVDLSIALPAVACSTCLCFELHASDSSVRIACKLQHMYL